MYKVLIRPLTVADASTSYKWRNDAEVWKYTGSRPDKPITEEIERDWLSNTLNDLSKKRFAIEVDDIYVGNIQLTNITDKSAEYHIFIGNRQYWNKGIAKLASYQLFRFAKEVLNIETIYLFVNTENVAAIKTYQKLGFIKDNDVIKMTLQLNTVKPPLVSVFMMVYNHAAFIEEAINSVLIQKADFDFEVVVGEDCSTDESRAILLNIASRYPGKFKLLLHSQNVGAVNNQNAILTACNGKYIAMLEGDDYWLDNDKLRKQCEFLETNEDYALVATSYQSVDEESNILPRPANYEKHDLTFSLILEKNIIATCTVVFRSAIINGFSIPKGIIGGDLIVWLFILQVNKGRMLDEITTSYRIHNTGAYSSLTFAEKCWFDVQQLYSIIESGFFFNKTKQLNKRLTNKKLSVLAHCSRKEERLINKVLEHNSNCYEFLLFKCLKKINIKLLNKVAWFLLRRRTRN
jgi:RimJ/RimL family protein N-acetyltransferase/glycosyltransferase involved in cell wall biosynthesis